MMKVLAFCRGWRRLQTFCSKSFGNPVLRTARQGARFLIEKAAVVRRFLFFHLQQREVVLVGKFVSRLTVVGSVKHSFGSC